MGIFSRSRTPASAPAWARYGQRATRQFLQRGYKGAKKERKRQIKLEGKFYQSRLAGIGAHRKAVKGDFESALATMRQGIGRTAAARGLGKSTVSLGTGATGQLLLQQQSALGAIDKTRFGEQAAHYERRAGIRPVNSAMYKYMLAKNRYGALENYGASGYSQRGKSPLGQLAGTAIGGYFGGPVGAGIGGAIGGMF